MDLVHVFESEGTRDSYIPRPQARDDLLDEDKFEERVESDEIIEEPLNIDEAQQRFKTANEVKTGFMAKEESLIERYQRLLYETDLLQQDMANNAASMNIDLRSHIVDLSERIKSMNTRIGDTPLEQLAATAKVEQLMDVAPLRSTTQRIIIPPIMTPDQIKNQELERRITNLERMIGLERNGASVERSLLSSSDTLIDSLERMDHHLSLLTQPEVFDRAVLQVKNATKHLESLARLKRKQKESTATPYESQIASLFTQMNKLEPISNMLPSIISRLQALQKIHGEASHFSDTIRLLAEDQTALKRIGIDTESGLQTLRCLIEENQSKTIENIVSFEERLNKI